MARKLPSHLKIHVAESLDSQANSRAVFDVRELMTSFAEATGWIPRPLAGMRSMGASSGNAVVPADGEPVLPLRRRIKLVCADPIDGALDHDIDLGSLDHITSEDAAWALLEQVDSLIQRLNTSEQAMTRQEAQLATSLGVSIRQDESEILAGRLQETLNRAIEQTGSDAAALYLLDDTTSQLKMRSCWGMSPSKLAQPSRDLRGSLGDLEALMGNAVLLENTAIAADWQCPEPYAAAMCVPVGSPTMPQGTVWLFSSHVRDFSSTHIDAAKAAADKILVDIERSVLADEVLKNRGLDRQIQSAGLTQSSRLPTTQKLHDDYDLAGWTFQGQALGGNFHTWNFNQNKEICAAIGSSMASGAAGALVATSLQTVVETCWNARHKPKHILRRANDVLWNTQEGDWRCSMAYLQLQPDSGLLQMSLAGDIQAFLFGPNGYRMLAGTTTPLASQPDTLFENLEIILQAGELLLFASSDVINGRHAAGFTQDELMQSVAEMIDEPVSDISDQLARKLPLLCANTTHEIDRSLLLLRRSF